MPYSNNADNVSEEIRLLMEQHSRLVQSVPVTTDDDWSLAQPSPFRFVPSVVTDSTVLSEQPLPDA
jgi:hypothetical protein